MDYRWKDGSRVGKLDAQKVGARLEKLKDRHGFITAEIVIEDAEKKTSPMHKGYFEWDDEKAARQHRLEQARSLVRSLVVTLDTGEDEPFITRAYVHLDAYEDVQTVASTPDKYDALMRQAVSYLKAAQRKYGNLKELRHVFEAIDLALKEIDT